VTYRIEISLEALAEIDQAFEISEDESTVYILHVVHGARDSLRPDHSGDEDEHGV